LLGHKDHQAQPFCRHVALEAETMNLRGLTHTRVAVAAFRALREKTKTAIIRGQNCNPAEPGE
jgi:hypothetical protein